MKKIMDNIRFKLASFLLKKSVIFYSDYYVDQFATLNTVGNYGKIYLRIDRSLPDSEKEYSIKL